MLVIRKFINRERNCKSNDSLNKKGKGIVGDGTGRPSPSTSYNHSLNKKEWDF